MLLQSTEACLLYVVMKTWTNAPQPDGDGHLANQIVMDREAPSPSTMDWAGMEGYSNSKTAFGYTMPQGLYEYICFSYGNS